MPRLLLFASLALVATGVVFVLLMRPAPSPWSDAPLEPPEHSRPVDAAAGAELEGRLAALAKEPEYTRCADTRSGPVPTDCATWIRAKTTELDDWFVGRLGLSFRIPTLEEGPVHLKALVDVARAAGRIADAQEPATRVLLATAGLRWGIAVKSATGDLVTFAVGTTMINDSLGAASRVARSLEVDSTPHWRLHALLREFPVGYDARRALRNEFINLELLYPADNAGFGRLTYSRAHTLRLARRRARAHLAQLNRHFTERTPPQSVDTASKVQRLLINPVGRALHEVASPDFLGILGREDVARGLHAGLVASLQGAVGDDGTGRPLRLENGVLIGSLDGVTVGRREVVMRWPALGTDGIDVPMAGLHPRPNGKAGP